MVGHGAGLGALRGAAGAEGGVAALGGLAARLVVGGRHELARLRVAARPLGWTVEDTRVIYLSIIYFNFF